MSELRADLPDEIIAVIDGYANATGRCRREIMIEILKPWADQKVREAIFICRVAGVNPNSSAGSR